jgi:hypothetical protein
MRNRSLCESCAMMREVLTPKGSRFLLCTMSATDQRYAKYPPQPVVGCDGYRASAPMCHGPGADGNGRAGDGMSAGD